MGYAIATKRLDKKLHKTIWTRKSRIFHDKFKAEVFLKQFKKRYPHDELHIIEV